MAMYVGRNFNLNCVHHGFGKHLDTDITSRAGLFIVQPIRPLELIRILRHKKPKWRTYKIE